MNRLIAFVVLAGGLSVIAYAARERWMPLIIHDSSAPLASSSLHHQAHSSDEHHGQDRPVVEFSDRARENLELKLGRVETCDWWRTISIPGVVTEQPGHSERRITTAVNGIVTGVHVFPGQTVRQGDPLLDIQPTGELLTTAQASLLKTLLDLELVELELKRILPLVENGSVPAKAKIDKDYEKTRLEAQRLIQMQELLVRGLSAEQINRIVETKKLIREFTIRVPVSRPERTSSVDRNLATGSDDDATRLIQPSPQNEDVYSIESIDIFPGKLVQPGEELCDLALHTHLNIVGHAFERESSLVGRAIKERWPIRAIFENEEGQALIREGLRVRFAENTIDQDARTLRFHIPLSNEVLRDDEGENGIIYRSWLFKPGQKVRLLLPIELLKDRIVLPADAVVKEGMDSFVFRANGKLLQRIPVQLEHIDSREGVLKRGGILAPGDVVALNQAYQINLALKKSLTMESGAHAGHEHAGHTHEH